MKGIDYERLLARKLSKLGFAVVRAPSSGSGTRIERPDIIAGRRGLVLAIEVKTTSKKKVYVREEGLKRLIRFSEKFGATPYVAVKFKGSGYDWFFISPQHFKKGGRMYSISLEEASKIGIRPEFLAARRLMDFS